MRFLFLEVQEIFWSWPIYAFDASCLWTCIKIFASRKSSELCKFLACMECKNLSPVTGSPCNMGNDVCFGICSHRSILRVLKKCRGIRNSSYECPNAKINSMLCGPRISIAFSRAFYYLHNGLCGSLIQIIYLMSHVFYVFFFFFLLFLFLMVLMAHVRVDNAQELPNWENSPC